MPRFHFATSLLFFGILCIFEKADADIEHIKGYYKCIACESGKDQKLFSAFDKCEAMLPQEQTDADLACFDEVFEDGASIETVLRVICEDEQKNGEFWECLVRKIPNVEQFLEQVEVYQKCLKQLNTTCKK